MRPCPSLAGGAKAKPLVQACRVWVVRAQPEITESPPRHFDDMHHQCPTHPAPPVDGPDVQMAHPADAVVASEGIDVEAADSDEAPVESTAEQDLARALEPVHTTVPLVDEPTDDP